MAYLFKSVILGGTFDHLHAGHQLLLSTAIKQSQQVTVGLVSVPTSKDFPDSIESYTKRLANLKNYLYTNRLFSRVTIIPIYDIYGTSLSDMSIEAIFVTDTTLANAIKIKLERQKLLLPPLQIIVSPLVPGDDGLTISSSRIRAGLIDRQGHSYLKYFLRKPIYHLPVDLRPTLQSPLGTAIKDLGGLAKILPPAALIISVGDIVSIDLQKTGYHPSVSIVDFHTRREPVSLHEIQTYFPHHHATLVNPAATINSEFAPLLLTSLKQSKYPQIIKVDGEEDLLTLPAILLSPLDSYIIYGQYQVGMCVVKVTEELKYQIKALLDQFF